MAIRGYSMTLQYKYKGNIYSPDNHLAMYDLLYKLTDAEQRIKELEAHRDKLQRELARLDKLLQPILLQ